MLAWCYRHCLTIFKNYPQIEHSLHLDLNTTIPLSKYSATLNGAFCKANSNRYSGTGVIYPSSACLQSIYWSAELYSRLCLYLFPCSPIAHHFFYRFGEASLYKFKAALRKFTADYAYAINGIPPPCSWFSPFLSSSIPTSLCTYIYIYCSFNQMNPSIGTLPLGHFIIIIIIIIESLD